MSTRIPTDDAVIALLRLPDQYQQVTIFLVDHLDWYDRTRGAGSDHDLAGGPGGFETRRGPERRRGWALTTIGRAVRAGLARPVTVVEVAQVSDAEFEQCFRRLAVLLRRSEAFAYDLEATAVTHAERAQATHHADNDLDRSRYNLLAAMALNLRLRVPGQLYDEYRFGRVPDPLVRLYRSSYGVTPYQLTDVPEQRMDFRFHTIGDGVWQPFDDPHPMPEPAPGTAVPPSPATRVLPRNLLGIRIDCELTSP